MNSKYLLPKAVTAIFLCLTLLHSSSDISAQSLPARSIAVTGGYSKHGSGDMPGIVFGAEYSKYRNKNWSFNYYFRGSINNSKHTILTYIGSAEPVDNSFRFTTAGVQAGVDARFSFVRNIQHELLISLGVFGRYQSASHGTDGYSLY